MTFRDCLAKGLIRKSESAPEKIAQSLEFGAKFLKSSKNNLKIEEHEVCILMSYNSLFQCARALLFAKGYVERSHACLFLALLELYPGEKELLLEADRFRLERHNLQYAGFSADAKDAQYSIRLAERFSAMAMERLGK